MTTPGKDSALNLKRHLCAMNAKSKRHFAQCQNDVPALVQEPISRRVVSRKRVCSYQNGMPFVVFASPIALHAQRAVLAADSAKAGVVVGAAVAAAVEAGPTVFTYSRPLPMIGNFSPSSRSSLVVGSTNKMSILIPAGCQIQRFLGEDRPASVPSFLL